MMGTLTLIHDAQQQTAAANIDAVNGLPALGTTDAPLPRAGEITLTPGQKLALLVMRGSDLSKQVLAGVLAKTKEEPAGRDFYTCARLGLAINKGKFHVLAREFRLHVLTYDLGGPGRAAFARCTCGFCAFKSRAIPSYALLIHQAGVRHLLQVSAGEAGRS
jgi:hypothetical protein